MLIHEMRNINVHKLMQDMKMEGYLLNLHLSEIQIYWESNHYIFGHYVGVGGHVCGDHRGDVPNAYTIKMHGLITTWCL